MVKWKEKLKVRKECNGKNKRWRNEGDTVALAWVEMGKEQNEKMKECESSSRF